MELQDDAGLKATVERIPGKLRAVRGHWFWTYTKKELLGAWGTKRKSLFHVICRYFQYEVAPEQGGLGSQLWTYRTIEPWKQ